ncbi:MAG: peptide-methionine (S)-S-oxide reductase MsrA [Acidobacteriaceae bacterium]
MEKATFGAGCFWGVQTTFDRIPGVVETIVGYEGGTLDSPSYRDVCTDRTGHAEVLQVEFDPTRVSYQQLLDAFFQAHNPTQLNRQGPDHGTQYRSVIFYHSPEQQHSATATIARLTADRKFSQPIVTQVVPAQTFWPAEEYHQKYLEKRGATSCHV